MQELPKLRDLAKVEADDARADIRGFFESAAQRDVPAPDQIEAIINNLLVPAWKAIGRHDILQVVIDQNFRSRDEIEQCYLDAKNEVADRARAVLMLRDVWKTSGLPDNAKKMLAQIESHLAAFYIATGAMEILQAMLAAPD